VKGNRVEFLSVSIDKDVAVTSNFLLKFPELKWKQGIAIKMNDVLDTLMISGIPCTILVSSEGVILAYGYELRGSRLLSSLEKIIK
jgi:hypothetical protein